jgi:hypothetical protein
MLNRVTIELTIDGTNLMPERLRNAICDLLAENLGKYSRQVKTLGELESFHLSMNGYPGLSSEFEP